MTQEENKKNISMGWIFTGITIVLALFVVFYTSMPGYGVKKEEIKVTNNLYEKQNNNSSGTILGSDSNTNNNQQGIIATNTQKEIVATTSTKDLTTNNIKKMKTAIIKTNMGEIEVELNLEKTPNTAANFAKLAGEKFYDGVRFHRVIKEFMIQTGDPQSKDLSKKSMWGTGGPGYKFADELKGDEKYPVGTLAMANSGPNTNGSQFFIVTAEPGYPLPALYTVFGKVTKGLDNALKINNTATDGSDRPLKDVIIESITVK